jgi:uncharacterized protein YndB with AHSA1/START domain
MSRNTITVDAPPQAVWEVLADPRLYANWVVGASTTREVEGRWPEVGATLHHTQMLLVHDTTTVLESEAPHLLVLEARARPLAVTRVEVRLEPDDDRTRVIFDESTTGALAGALPGLLSDPLLHVRNDETVRRLKRLAEIGRQIGRN